MKTFFEEFKKFALRGNVMNMAIGVIIGGAFQAIVNSLVNDIISPLIGSVAKTDFSAWVITINGVDVCYGSFITAIINFIIMAFVIFVIVRAINKLTEPKEAPAPAEPTEKECPYCKKMIPITATRCCHCTSQVE